MDAMVDDEESNGDSTNRKQEWMHMVMPPREGMEVLVIPPQVSAPEKKAMVIPPIGTE